MIGNYTIRWLRSKYISLRWRVLNHPLYKGLGACSEKAFLKWALADPEFNRIWNDWPKRKYARKFGPSIDRLDNKKGYFIGNMRFVEVKYNKPYKCVKKTLQKMLLKNAQRDKEKS